MSTLACITVRECNLCKRVVTLKTAAEYTTYEATWLEGTFIDLCPVCREKDEAIDIVVNDMAMRRTIARAAKKYGTEKIETTEAGYVN